MIHLRLSGGLGNQLYQLAAASLLSRRSRQPVTVYLEGLQRYDSPRAPDFIKVLAPNDWMKPAGDERRSISRWLSVTARAGRVAPIIGVNDGSFLRMLDRQPSSLPMYVDGYFQHGWTAAHFAEALSAMPVQPASAVAQQRLDADETVVHIRGGDFLKLPKFQVVHAPFYAEAVRQALVQGRQRFAVITDDPAYANQVCEEVARTIPAASFRVLGRGANAMEDFDTLRGATGRIIGNSTFAWWASALGGSGRPTWSPTRLTVDEPRDFYLPDEIPIKGV
jgi:hypothetical protein